MARKKHHTKATQRRTHKKSSMGATVVNAGMEAGGTIAGGLIAHQIPKYLPATMDSKLANAAVVIVGILLPKFVKTPIMKSVGAGMVAIGGVGLVGSFIPALAGVEDTIMLSGQDSLGDVSEVNGVDDGMNGLDDGMGDVSEVNGYDEY